MYVFLYFISKEMQIVIKVIGLQYAKLIVKVSYLFAIFDNGPVKLMEYMKIAVLFLHVT